MSCRKHNKKVHMHARHLLCLCFVLHPQYGGKRRYEEKMRAEGLRRLQDEPADAAAEEPITSIEV